MISFFIEFEEVEDYATVVIDKMRDDLVGSDKRITHRNFADNFGDLFEDYREAYIEANRQAYAVYTDEQIKALYDFYKSEFGVWYLKEVEAFGPRVRELMTEPNKILQAGVVVERKNLPGK